MWGCCSGVWGRGHSNFGGGEGIREIRRQWKEIWRARKEEEVRDRLGSKRGGNIRTLYKRKGVKVVPVDEGHAAGEKPAGEAGWRERLLAEEKARQLDAGKYVGILVPKFSKIKRGERLTPERLAKLEMGK